MASDLTMCRAGYSSGLRLIASACGWLISWALSHETQAADSFVQRFCLECHDTSTRKGNVDLSLLAENSPPGLNEDLWVRAYDQVEIQTMPPRRARMQPTALDRSQWLQETREALVNAGEQRRRREGRAPLRRLSKTELQNTLSQLCGVPLDLALAFPEENPRGGYMRLGQALEISPQHLLGLQRAADLALDQLLPSRPWLSESRQTSGAEWLKRQQSAIGRDWEIVLRWGARTRDSSALVCFQSSQHDYLQIPIGQPARPGRYRIRARLAAEQTQGRPLTVALILSGYSSQPDPTLQRILELRDVSGTGTTLLEVEVQVPAQSARWEGRSVLLTPWSLPAQPLREALQAEELIGNRPRFTGPTLRVDWVSWEGPLDPWPGRGFERLFGASRFENRQMRDARRKSPTRAAEALWTKLPPNAFDVDPCRLQSDQPESDAKARLSSILPIVFRRPVAEPELTEFLSRFQASFRATADFHLAMRMTLKAALCSPEFVFLGNRPGELDAYGLASRLSYFLRSEPPDDTLILKAGRGELKQRPALFVEVDRLLNLPQRKPLLSDFTDAWLELYRIQETTPNRAYGEFDDGLLWSMTRETLSYVERMVREDRPAVEWVRSDWGILNERLAQHYSVPGVLGMELRDIKWPAGSPRGGVITHASILKLTSNGTVTSPVKRGAWILDRILGDPPSPPPPGTPAIEPDIRGAATIRQQLDQHRNQPACNRCHRVIDPPGLALENFDVIGGWREWYRVLSPDGSTATARLPNYPALSVWRGPDVERGILTAEGEQVSDIREFRDHLARQHRRIAASLVEKLITYGTGANPEFADRTLIQSMLTAAESQGFGMRTLLKEVVGSRIFLEQ